MDLHVKAEPASGTLTILEGKTLEPKHPQKIKLSGNILSIGAFLAARTGQNKGLGKQLVDKSTAIVVVDRAKMTIDLFLDPQDCFGAEVHGALEFTPELQQWHINGTKTFTREELVKLIRFNGLNFPSKDAHQELLEAYMKLDVSTSGSLNAGGDQRGNKAVSFVKYVSSNVPMEFILEVPIFKGFDPEQFRVEICMDATDASVRFWFESIELKELIEVKKDVIFNEELSHCKGLLIIEK